MTTSLCDETWVRYGARVLSELYAKMGGDSHRTGTDSTGHRNPSGLSDLLTETLKRSLPNDSVGAGVIFGGLLGEDVVPKGIDLALKGVDFIFDLALFSGPERVEYRLIHDPSKSLEVLRQDCEATVDIGQVLREVNHEQPAHVGGDLELPDQGPLHREFVAAIRRSRRHHAKVSGLFLQVREVVDPADVELHESSPSVVGGGAATPVPGETTVGESATAGAGSSPSRPCGGGCRPDAPVSGASGRAARPCTMRRLYGHCPMHDGRAWA